MPIAQLASADAWLLRRGLTPGCRIHPTAEAAGILLDLYKSQGREDGFQDIGYADADDSDGSPSDLVSSTSIFTVSYGMWGFFAPPSSRK